MMGMRDEAKGTTLFGVLPVATFLDEVDEMLDGLSLRYTLLDTLLSLVEIDLARCSTYIAIVRISHFARTINDTAHDTDLEPLEV